MNQCPTKLIPLSLKSPTNQRAKGGDQTEAAVDVPRTERSAGTQHGGIVRTAATARILTDIQRGWRSIRGHATDFATNGDTVFRGKVEFWFWAIK